MSTNVTPTPQVLRGFTKRNGLSESFTSTSGGGELVTADAVIKSLQNQKGCRRDRPEHLDIRSSG